MNGMEELKWLKKEFAPLVEKNGFLIDENADLKRLLKAEQKQREVLAAELADMKKRYE